MGVRIFIDKFDLINSSYIKYIFATTNYCSLTLDIFIYYVISAIIGEGNGNPLQYSCLENTMDGGAWWAAVYGVTHNIVLCSVRPKL